MRDHKPYWWTGIVRMDQTLGRVILSLQCINPRRDGFNGLTLEQNVQDWFNFAARPADPAAVSRTENLVKVELQRAYVEHPDLNLLQVACLAVLNILLLQAREAVESPATTVVSGIVINIQRENAMRVSGPGGKGVAS